MNLLYFQSASDSRRYVVGAQGEYGIITGIEATPLGVIVTHASGDRLLVVPGGYGAAAAEEPGQAETAALSCSGCGREFARPAALASHQRHCSSQPASA